MVFKPRARGGGGGPPSDLALEIEALGGDVNAYTAQDETVFHATVPSGEWQAGLRALVGAVFGRSFDARELERETQVVVEEIKQYDDDPWSSASQRLWSRMFPAHAYGRPILGTEAEVRGHTSARLAGYYRRAYRPELATLVVAGPGARRADVARVVSALLPSLRDEAGRSGTTKRVAPRRVSPATGAFDGGGIGVTREDVNEAQLLLGWRVPEIGSTDGLCLDLAAVILGHGEASRLTTRVRREQQQVAEAGATLSFAREASTFIVHAHTDTARVGGANTALMREIEQLRAHEPSSEEHARARTMLESSALYRRETVQGEAHALGYFATLLGDPGAEAELLTRLRALRPQDIRDACARWLSTEARTAVVAVSRQEVSPQGLRSLRRQLCGTAGRRKIRVTRSTPRQDSGGVWHAELANGLRVRARIDQRLPLAAGWLVWPGGIRAEPARLAGVSSLAASLLLRGTSRRSGLEMAQELECRAAALGGFCGRGTLGLQFECLSRHLPTVTRLAAECATHPTFPEREFAEERRVVLQALEADEADVGQIAWREMLRGLYGRHPFQRDVRGNAASLARLQVSDVRRLWITGYPWSGGVLALAGSFDFPAFLADLAAAVCDDAAQADTGVVVAKSPPSIAWPRRSRRREVIRSREQAHACVGYPGLHLGHPDQAALDVLMGVLGSQTGRLFVTLREREGLVYQVGATSTESMDAGHVALYLAASQHNLEPALGHVDREVQRIQETLVNGAELDRARRWLVGQHHAGLQRRSRIAADLAFATVYGLPDSYYFDYARRVSAVTASQLRVVARKIFSAPSVTAIVRDEI